MRQFTGNAGHRPHPILRAVLEGMEFFMQENTIFMQIHILNQTSR
jgi:hypothetical protein